MTAYVDKPGETGGGMAADAVGSADGCGRDAVTREVCRGTGRLLRAMNFSVVNELVLANGRRADIAAISAAGDIWIVEVKSCFDDLRVDAKWPEYREFCDALFFAVNPGFPVDVLPADTGLILADRYGGEIVRQAPEHRLVAARRKAVTLRYARAAAFTLQAFTDPSLENS